MPKHEFMTDDQYDRFVELLQKFNSRKRMSIQEDAELEDLMELDAKTYETPEYKTFAAEMDAKLHALWDVEEEVAS